MALKAKLKTAAPKASIGAPLRVGVRVPGLGFTPTPLGAPAGSYPPELAYNEQAAGRGFGDVLQDYAPTDPSALGGLQRFATHLQQAYPWLALGAVAPGRLTQREESAYLTNKDLAMHHGGESLSDLLLRRGRAGEDFTNRREGIDRAADTAAGDTRRGFDVLGARQADQLNAANALDSGAAIASGQVRQANEDRTLGRIEESRGLSLDALGRAVSRFGTDSATEEQRLTGGGVGVTTDANGNPMLAGTPSGGSVGETLANLAKQHEYATSDAATNVARAGRELGTYLGTTEAQKLQAAKQTGAPIPQRPSNEFFDEHGPYRVVVHGGERLEVRPNGRISGRAVRAVPRPPVAVGKGVAQPVTGGG